ncbi:MAG TPA: hypothetical protein VFN85_05330 [Solirubrobacterales bacterium]|nr:hypothetical protein [Solirubrobacterales bacterium]
MQLEVRMEAATRYADSDGVSIAYQVHGEGAPFATCSACIAAAR